jgi:hypothetical protein
VLGGALQLMVQLVRRGELLGAKRR